MSQKPSDPDLPAVQNAALETAEARSAGEPVDEFDAVLPKRSVLRNLIWATPSWLLSMILHVILLLAMAMLYLPAGAVDDVRDLLLASGEEEMLDELEDFEDEPLQTLDVVTSDALVLESVVEPTDIQMANFDEPAAAVQVDLSDFGLEQAPANDLLATVGAYSGDALSGRGAERERLVRATAATTPASRLSPWRSTGSPGTRCPTAAGPSITRSAQIAAANAAIRAAWPRRGTRPPRWQSSPFSGPARRTRRASTRRSSTRGSTT